MAEPDRERFLEYDLTRLIWELSNPRRPVLGVMSSLPLNGDPRAMMMRQPGIGQPYVVSTQLRQFYTVRDVPLDAQVIEPDVQVLLVAHAQNLSDATLYAIDQFVMRGGRGVFLVDHVEIPAGSLAAVPVESGVHDLLERYGVKVARDVVGEPRLNAPAAFSSILEYPLAITAAPWPDCWITSTWSGMSSVIAAGSIVWALSHAV